MQNQAAERLDKSVQVSTLCAYYGGMLTSKQLEALRLHYDEDLSLAEVAEQLQVSRQGVHELITRSEEKLRRIESELGAIQRAEAVLKDLAEANRILEQTLAQVTQPRVRGSIKQAMELISASIAKQEGEESSHGV